MKRVLLMVLISLGASSMAQAQFFFDERTGKGGMVLPMGENSLIINDDNTSSMIYNNTGKGMSIITPADGAKPAAPKGSRTTPDTDSNQNQNPNSSTNPNTRGK